MASPNDRPTSLEPDALTVGASEGNALSASGVTDAHADDQQEFAGQWQLAWWKFKRHKLAMASGVVVILIYVVAVFADFLAPTDPGAYAARYTFAPPQVLHLWDTDGGFHIAPYVEGYKVKIDPASLRRVFTVDPSTRIPVGFLVHGVPYKMWGLIPSDLHLFGPLEAGQPMYLWGADRLGRDMLSRVIFGTRVSMSIGLVGVGLSLIFGIVLGGISGFYGGWVDMAIQRVIEFLLAIPTIPLWMGLAAAIPPTVPPVRVYFLITIILSVVGWTGLARVVRGRFLALKTEDFVTAAHLDGASQLGIILRHMVPSFASHIIAAVTLAIPVMILSETSLSFLGIGLRPPVVSWGVLLQEAQNIRAVATAPWLLLPGLAVIVAVLALNFLGDGLRDAADPYGQ